MNFKSIGKNVKISDMARIYKPEVIEIGDNVRIDDFCMLSGGKGIKIGNHIHIACGTYLYGGGGIILEDFVGISTHVNIWSQSDDFSGNGMQNPQVPAECKPTIKYGLVTLKKHVLVGCGVSIMPNVTIGEGTSVGAHSIVLKDLDEWSIYAGIPAIKIKDRSKKVLEYEKLFWEKYNKLTCKCE